MKSGNVWTHSLHFSSNIILTRLGPPCISTWIFRSAYTFLQNDRIEIRIALDLENIIFLRALSLPVHEHMSIGCFSIYLDCLWFTSVMYCSFQCIRLAFIWLNVFLNTLFSCYFYSGIGFLNSLSYCSLLHYRNRFFFFLILI